MKFLLLLIIGIYQKWVSPYKGFQCAHHTYYGRSTCSVYGKSAITKHGAITGSKLIHRRFKACSFAVQRLAEDPPKDENNKKKGDDDVAKCMVLEAIGEVGCCTAFTICS